LQAEGTIKQTLDSNSPMVRTTFLVANEVQEHPPPTAEFEKILK
jgi:hypothetical protein